MKTIIICLAASGLLAAPAIAEPPHS